MSEKSKFHLHLGPIKELKRIMKWDREIYPLFISWQQGQTDLSGTTSGPKDSRVPHERLLVPLFGHRRPWQQGAIQWINKDN